MQPGNPRARPPPRGPGEPPKEPKIAALQGRALWGPSRPSAPSAGHGSYLGISRRPRRWSITSEFDSIRTWQHFSQPSPERTKEPLRSLSRTSAAVRISHCAGSARDNRLSRGSDWGKEDRTAPGPNREPLHSIVAPSAAARRRPDGHNPTLASWRFVILGSAPLISLRSRPAWISMQLKDDSGIWISSIIKWNRTGGVNGTISLPVNITTKGHAIGVMVMGNVTSGGRMPRIPTTGRYVQFSPRGTFD